MLCSFGYELFRKYERKIVIPDYQERSKKMFFHRVLAANIALTSLIKSSCRAKGRGATK